MDLRLYLFVNKITQTAFARRLGISRCHLCAVVKGNCSIKLAEKIESFTGGQVKALELRPSRKDGRTREMRELRDRTKNKG